MLRLSKSGMKVFVANVRREDRRELQPILIETARAARSTQVGAKHVYEVLAVSPHLYAHFGDRELGGPGSGPTDPPRDAPEVE